jgi:V/A-type H+-transporting ATPase subunit F
VQPYFFIGGEELLIALRLAGADGTVCNDAASAKAAFATATEKNSGCYVLIIQEDTAALLTQEMTDWQLKGELPLIVELPPLSGHDASRKSLTDSIRESIGLHV